MSKEIYEATEWPVPGVLLKSCPRCDEGAIETDQNGDISCLTCGYVKYFQSDYPAPDPTDDTARARREQRKTHKNKGKSKAAVGSES